MSEFTIYIVDDEKDIRDSLSDLLEASGYTVKTFASSSPFLSSILTSKGSGACLIDLALGKESGMALLEQLKSRAPQYTCAVISGMAEVPLAVKALQAGARDFFEKPLRAGRILAWLKTVKTDTEKECERRQLLSDTLGHYTIAGSSAVMNSVRRQISEYAPLAETILVTGETGTGKELAAAQLHYRSPRRSRPYKAINIAALPPELIESQLFGYTKGAFSGAQEANEGLIRSSRKSSLFLDEIGEMKIDLQAKLLRTLQNHEVLSIGCTKPETVDVRFICATNKNLENEVQKGRFRKDLYYRLSTLTIKMPPLREHREDIPELANLFLGQFAREYSQPQKELSQQALDKLAAYSFPGNVRELQSLLLKALLKSNSLSESNISETCIEFSSGTPPATSPAETALFSAPGELSVMKRRMEKYYIETRLTANGWSVPNTAEELGILPANLYRRMRALGINR